MQLQSVTIIRLNSVIFPSTSLYALGNQMKPNAFTAYSYSENQHFIAHKN